jgi:hypothetical protein
MIRTTSSLWPRTRTGLSRRLRRAPRRAPARRPTLDVLETRELLTFTGFTADNRPKILFPANTRFVPIVITGTVNILEKRLVPQLNFQVVDEYRLIQPSGPVKARRLEGQPGAFTFSFTVSLQAKVRAHDRFGRQYFITVAARDSKGSVGKVLPVLVPNPDMGPPQGASPSGRPARPAKLRL